MRLFALLIPIAGTLIAASVPLVRYAIRDRDERAAIDAVRRVAEAQRAFRTRAGGYATNLESLTSTCDAAPPALASDVLAGLADAGYALELRAAEGAAVADTDCRGHQLAHDYYVAAVPLSSDVPARQAVASRGDGRILLFHDGIAPREEDFATGLPTPVEARETFKIP